MTPILRTWIAKYSRYIITIITTSESRPQPTELDSPLHTQFGLGHAGLGQSSKQRYWPVAQIPRCTNLISHNAPFCNRNVHMCAHVCYKMVHCGIFVQCNVGFARRVYHIHVDARVGDRVPSQYKDRLSKYGDFHFKPSYLDNGSSFTVKTASLCWDAPPPPRMLLKRCWENIKVTPFFAVWNASFWSNWLLICAWFAYYSTSKRQVFSINEQMKTIVFETAVSEKWAPRHLDLLASRLLVQADY